MYPAILGSPVLVWPTNSNRSEQRGFQLGDQLELGHTTHLSNRDKSITGRSLEACGCNVHSIMFLSGKFLTPKPCKSPKSRCICCICSDNFNFKSRYICSSGVQICLHSLCMCTCKTPSAHGPCTWLAKRGNPKYPKPSRVESCSHKCQLVTQRTSLQSEINRLDLKPDLRITQMDSQTKTDSASQIWKDLTVHHGHGTAIGKVWKFQAQVVVDILRQFGGCIMPQSSVKLEALYL